MKQSKLLQEAGSKQSKGKSNRRRENTNQSADPKQDDVPAKVPPPPPALPYPLPAPKLMHRFVAGTWLLVASFSSVYFFERHF